MTLHQNEKKHLSSVDIPWANLIWVVCWKCVSQVRAAIGAPRKGDSQWRRSVTRLATGRHDMTCPFFIAAITMRSLWPDRDLLPFFPCFYPAACQLLQDCPPGQVCRSSPCPKLPGAPANGRIDLSFDKCTVTYSCDPGYKLSNPLFVSRCQVDGSWSMDTPAISCDRKDNMTTV